MKNISKIKTKIIAGILSVITIVSIGAMCVTTCGAAEARPTITYAARPHLWDGINTAR